MRTFLIAMQNNRLHMNPSLDRVEVNKTRQIDCRKVRRKAIYMKLLSTYEHMDPSLEREQLKEMR